jgi:hypothetical protein
LIVCHGRDELRDYMSEPRGSTLAFSRKYVSPFGPW